MKRPPGQPGRLQGQKRLPRSFQARRRQYTRQVKETDQFEGDQPILDTFPSVQRIRCRELASRPQLPTGHGRTLCSPQRPPKLHQNPLQAVEELRLSWQSASL